MALTVNGRYVGDEVFLEEFLRLSQGASPDQVRARSREELMLLEQATERNVVERTVLLEMAERQGFWPAEGEIEREQQRRGGSPSGVGCSGAVKVALGREMAMVRMSEYLTRHVPRPTRAEVEAAYRANGERFRQPERVLAAHILRRVETESDEAEARAALEQAELELGKGRPFAAVADRYSDCKGVGGAVGWIARGEMVEPFEEVVFALPVKGRSGVFRTVFGLHVATCLGRKAAGVQPLEEVRMELQRGMHEARRRTVLEAEMRRQVAQAVVAVAATDRSVPAAEEVLR